MISNSSRVPFAATLAFMLSITGFAHGAVGPLTNNSKPKGTVISSVSEITVASPGLTYFLPRKLLKVTIKRSVEKLDDVQKSLTQAQSSLKEANDNTKAATTKRKDAEAILKGLKETDPYFSDAKEEVSKTKAEEILAKSKQDELTKKVTDLLGDVQRIQALGGEICAYEATAELQPAQADTTLRFVASQNHSLFRDDTTKLTVSPEGLLSSANVVATDRTSEILVNLAGSLSGMKILGFDQGPVKDATCASLPKQFIQVFDPAVPAEIDQTNADIISAKFPFQISVTQGNTATPVTALPASVDQLNKSDDTTSGLYYRTPFPAVLTLKETGVPVASSVIMLPQAGPISFIPMKASPFVKTVSDVQFTDGIISSWNLDRPSELVEAFSIPVKIGKAILSIPAEWISLKVDLSDKQKALLDKQKAEMEATLTMNKIKTCIALATDDDTKLKCVAS